MKPIRSYVKRQGRITSGQKKALNTLFAKYGLEYTADPFDFATIFTRAADVALEIGFGDGEAMLQTAIAQPEMDFIGIEVYEAGAGRLLANIEKQGLTNVRVMTHDAVEVLEHNIPDVSLTRVMIFFPDPWHKNRHHKRRLIQAPFIKLLSKKLKPGGVLHCATDWENYAEQMLAVLGQEPSLKNTAENNGFVARPELRPLTKFEQRGQRLGHGVWDLVFKKLT